LRKLTGIEVLRWREEKEGHSSRREFTIKWLLVSWRSPDFLLLDGQDCWP
jgi:hypothetical protein